MDEGRNPRESGAALVEMALVAPLLLLLLFGIIEASWAFSQTADLRHGAREGARLAAVDFGDRDVIRAEVCSRMDLSTDPARVEIVFSDLNGTGERNDSARITVRQQYSSLTGFLDGIFQDKMLTSSIEFRLERPVDGTASWWGAPDTDDPTSIDPTLDCVP